MPGHNPFRFAILKLLSLRGENLTASQLAVLLDGVREGSAEWCKLVRLTQVQE